MKNFTPKKTPGEVSYADLTPYDKALVEKAVKSGHSRRDVLKLMMVTGVSVAAAQNLLSTGGEAMASTPKKGGSVRYAQTCTAPMISSIRRNSPPPSTTAAGGLPITAWFSTPTTCPLSLNWPSLLNLTPTLVNGRSRFVKALLFTTAQS